MLVRQRFQEIRLQDRVKKLRIVALRMLAVIGVQELAARPLALCFKIPAKFAWAMGDYFVSKIVQVIPLKY